MSHKLSNIVTQIVKYCHTNCQILSSEAENSDPSQVLLLGFCIFALYCGPYLSSYFPPHVSDYLRSLLLSYKNSSCLQKGFSKKTVNGHLCLMKRACPIYFQIQYNESYHLGMFIFITGYSYSFKTG